MPSPFLAETVDALETAVARCDREGRVVYCNAAFSRRLGSMGGGLADRIHPEDVPALEAILQVATGERRSVRVRFLGESAVSVVRAAGLSDGVAVEIGGLSTSDDADRAVADQRLDALARLADGMANDFANVLSIIIHYADFALHTEMNARTRHYLEAIRTGADRAAQLTDELLLFARGRGAGALDLLDVGGAIEERRDLLARVSGAEVALQIDVSAAVPPVRLARASLDQALMNLCTNAREAMPRGGRVRIEAGPLSLAGLAAEEWSLAPGDYARIAVIDDGPGMTAEVRARALEPFFTTRGEHRRGLGLSVVYGVVRAAGGTMRVRSEPGGGTAVELVLPAAAALPARATKGIPAQGHGETVLVVDDEPLVRAMTAQILLENGYDAIEACSPEEALALFEGSNEPCHLLLTDIVMPRMSGAQLAERVRTLRPGARVLFMSGYGSPSILAVPSVASVPLLDKPFEAEALLSAVRHALDV